MNVAKFELIGNGNCDDLNNNKECNYDKGDCCDTSIWKWIGNGHCDDENNKEECHWDGGDCCGNNVVTVNRHDDPTCFVCECLEPDFHFMSEPFKWNDDNCDDFRQFICEKEGTGL